MQRNVERLNAARESIAYGKVSGAVGTHANIEPKVEEWVCERLGLKPAPVSTQILQRDRHAQFMTTLAILAGSLEKFATELRNLQRTEILEVQEYLRGGTARLLGDAAQAQPVELRDGFADLARVVRGNAVPALEDVTTWHERDLANSSVERIILPDTCILLDWMLRKFTNILDTLIVYPENMQKNLEKMGGLVASEQVMLALDREGSFARRRLQSRAAQRREGLVGKRLQGGSGRDPTVKEHLTASEIEHVFDLRYHLKHIDETFRRLGL